MATPAANCRQCGSALQPGAKFCVECGNRVGGGCPHCGAETPASAQFCTSCGASLAAGGPPEKGARWTRRAGEIACRVEGADLKGGIFSRLVGRKSINIEEGTRGVVLQHGKLAGVLNPGSHTVESITKRLTRLNFSSPYTVILVDVGDIELGLRAGELRTADHQTTQAAIKVVVGIDDPQNFFTNVMRGQTRVTADELSARLAQESMGVLRNIVAECKLDELYGNRELVERIEDELRESLKPTLARYGLAFVNLQFVDFFGDTFEEVRRRRQETNQAAAEVADEQQRADVRGQRREAKDRDRRHEFETEAQYQEFKKQVAHESDVKQRLRNEESADYDSAAKQREAERRVQEAGKEVVAREAEHEVESLEQRQKFYLDQQKQEAELAHRGREFETELDEDRRSAEMALDLQKQWDDRKLARRRGEDEADLDKQRGQQELERERLLMLSEASTEALIASSDAEQAKLLAQLKTTESLKDFSSDQILALAAQKSPQVAQAFAEKFRAAEGAQSAEQVKELYERMLTVQKSAGDEMAAAQRDNNKMLKELMETALQAQRDTTVAANQGRSPAVVYPPVGGAPATAGLTDCPQCRAKSPVGSAFCGNCGFRFA